ncbi:MAG: hypothetical protein Q9195_004412 [Heterodermia aff. obscurata]
MADSQGASLVSAPKKHSRNASYNRTPLARRSTRGPLDVDDSPLSASLLSEASNVPIPTTPFSPPKPQSPPPEPPLLPPSPPPKDFSYLQRPEIFHPLSNLDIPPPFRTSPHDPPFSPITPLPTLLLTHNYRLAAISAATTLTTTPSLPPPHIFSLLYTRLASLTLLNLTHIAAQESKPLEDIHSPFYHDPTTGHSILPWELRVLVVRLQGIAYGDLKRAVVGYYDLARDTRREIQRARSEEQSDVEGGKVWTGRLTECGICVGNMLIEMGDLGAARRHFESLRRGESDEVLDGRLALLCLRMGDVHAARRYLEAGKDDDRGEGTKDVIRPLLSMADGCYEDAVKEWRALRGGKWDTIATQNLAVCLLYAGRLHETSALLTSLIDNGHSFHALTFNLATVYELSTERSRAQKLELAEKVAGLMKRGGGGVGEEGEGDEGEIKWAERGNADFKL